jgi:hypothetical protein
MKLSLSSMHLFGVPANKTRSTGLYGAVKGVVAVTRKPLRALKANAGIIEVFY